MKNRVSYVLGSVHRVFRGFTVRQVTPLVSIQKIAGFVVLLGVTLFFLPRAVPFVFSRVQEFAKKSGFDYWDNPSADYLYQKETENYTAYAVNRKSGAHAMRLSAGEFSFEYALAGIHNASSSGEKIEQSIPSNDEARQVLDRIQSLIQSIEKHSDEIDQMLTGGLYMPPQVTAARLVDTPSERSVMYEHIAPGMDIRYRLDEGGIKEEIFLHDASHIYTSFVYSYDAHGLSVESVGSGVWYFSDTAADSVFRIPKGWAKDAAGAFTNDVTIDVRDSVLVMHINEQWVSSEDRVFPIVIDSSIEIVPEKRKTRGFEGVLQKDIPETVSITPSPTGEQYSPEDGAGGETEESTPSAQEHTKR